MTSNRLPVVVPAIPPKPPFLSLLNSALRPDKTSDPGGNPLGEITSEQLAALPDDLRHELEIRKGEFWTRGLTYAPENHWAAEVRDACDNASVDLPALEAPRNVKLAEKAGKGTLAAEALEYQVTAKNANGQTTALAIKTITLSAEGAVLVTWKKVSEDTFEKGVTYLVYRAKGTKKPLLIAEVGPFDGDQAAEYLDTGAAAEKAGKEPPSSNTTGGSGKYTNLPLVTYFPFLVMVEDYCSTFGFEERDFKGRAERLLENAQYAAVEKEFWSGALAKAKSYPNQYLTKKAETGWTPENLTPGTVPSVERGFEILQKALSECGFGGQGMIHAQPHLVPSFLRVRLVGNQLVDMFGNQVVSGTGYNAEVGFEETAPVSGNAWICATDLVSCRVEDDPTVVTESFAEMTDWSQNGEPNTIRLRAQKFAAAYADFGCGPFWTEVKLPS